MPLQKSDFKEARLLTYFFRIALPDGLRVLDLEDQDGSDYKLNSHQEPF